MKFYPFYQVNVFSDHPLKGNPLAVVLDADDLSDAQMLDFARWTNLSETTFLLAPRSPGADYRLRIFTPRGELPFAGHPTLGSCHIWLSRQPQAPVGRDIIQECAAGLIRIRHDPQRLAFQAPASRVSGTLDPQTLAEVSAALGLSAAQIVAHQHVGAASDWLSLLLDSRESVLAIRPDYARLGKRVIGVAARVTEGPVQLEVRAFEGETQSEDPVTGSLNAGLALWLTEAGWLTAPYVAAQGSALGREGRVDVRADERGELWIGGEVKTVIGGQLASFA